MLPRTKGGGTGAMGERNQCELEYRHTSVR
jgi:hypothetical protein